jgi:signal transduction histidine kinase
MQDDLAPHTRESLEELSAGARRMATTITTLLELARTQENLIDAASCSLAEVVTELVNAMPPRDVTIDVEDLADHRIAAPHAIAARALAPVLDNAARFAHTRIRVSSSTRATGSVLVVVEDDGPGVDNTTDIFLPGTTTQGGSGAGLGLALARRMARSVGGDIRVLSPSEPTQFELEFPRA